MIYAYLRVSTDHQDEENQKLGVSQKAVCMGTAVDSYVIDRNVSGAIPVNQRRLGKLTKRLKPGDVLIVSELSRLSRSMFELFRLLEMLLNKGVEVYSVKDGFELKDDIQSKVLAFAFGMAAEIERNLLRQRTQENIQLRRSQGLPVGRKPGARNIKHLSDRFEKRIESLLDQGNSIYGISKKYHCSPGTIRNYMKAHNLTTLKTYDYLANNLSAARRARLAQF